MKTSHENNRNLPDENRNRFGKHAINDRPWGPWLKWSMYGRHKAKGKRINRWCSVNRPGTRYMTPRHHKAYLDNNRWGIKGHCRDATEHLRLYNDWTKLELWNKKSRGWNTYQKYQGAKINIKPKHWSDARVENYDWTNVNLEKNIPDHIDARMTCCGIKQVGHVNQTVANSFTNMCNNKTYKYGQPKCNNEWQKWCSLKGWDSTKCKNHVKIKNADHATKQSIINYCVKHNMKTPHDNGFCWRVANEDKEGMGQPMLKAVCAKRPRTRIRPGVFTSSKMCACWDKDGFKAAKDIMLGACTTASCKHAVNTSRIDCIHGGCTGSGDAFAIKRAGGNACNDINIQVCNQNVNVGGNIIAGKMLIACNNTIKKTVIKKDKGKPKKTVVKHTDQKDAPAMAKLEKQKKVKIKPQAEVHKLIKDEMAKAKPKPYSLPSKKPDSPKHKKPPTDYNVYISIGIIVVSLIGGGIYLSSNKQKTI